MTAPYDPAQEGAEMSFNDRMSYSDYLHLERVLDHPDRPFDDLRASGRVLPVVFAEHRLDQTRRDGIHAYALGP